MLEWQTPAVSVGIEKGGEIVLARGYGFSDIENRVAATENTVYRIGSVTKQFTAAAILLLVEDGKLSLDDDLSSVLPVPHARRAHHRRPALESHQRHQGLHRNAGVLEAGA